MRPFERTCNMLSDIKQHVEWDKSVRVMITSPRAMAHGSSGDNKYLTLQQIAQSIPRCSWASLSTAHQNAMKVYTTQTMDAGLLPTAAPKAMPCWSPNLNRCARDSEKTQAHSSVAQKMKDRKYR